MKFHIHDHLCLDLENSRRLKVLLASIYENSNVGFKRSYCRISTRRATGMRETASALKPIEDRLKMKCIDGVSSDQSLLKARRLKTLKEVAV